jgi:hypothetical protein
MRILLIIPITGLDGFDKILHPSYSTIQKRMLLTTLQKE